MSEHHGKGRSIQSRLVVLLLFVLIPVVIIQAYMYYDRFQAQRDHELRSNLEIARAAGEMLEGFVNDVLHQELSIGQTFTLHYSLSVAEMNTILAENKAEYPAVRDFLWIDHRGIIIASSSTALIGLDVSDSPYYDRMIAGKNWTMIDLYPSRITGEPVFGIARTIRDRAGALKGFVVAIVEPERLHDVLSIDRTLSGAISFLDSRGMLVYRYPRIDLTWESRNWAKTYPFVEDVLKGKEVSTTILATYENKRRIVAMIPTSFGWAAAAGRREEDVVAPIFSSLAMDIVLFLSVSFLAFVIALVISRRIAGPVEALRAHALAIGRGEYPEEARMNHVSEFQDLASSFNTMAEKVRSREKAIRDSEERFHRALEHIPDVLVIYDRDLRVRYINSATLRITGRPTSDFIGRKEEEIWPPEVCDVYLPTLRKAFETRTTQYLQTDLLLPERGLRTMHITCVPILDEKGEALEVLGITHDFTKRKRIELEQDVAVQFLRLANECGATRDLVQAAAGFFQRQSGCEAVGIRLQEGYDYPYFEARGFPMEFVQAESSLCTRSAGGEVIRDSIGQPVLECMCGNVICGRFDPSKPFFSEGGSFWTNCTTELLATTTEADRKARTRNRCNGEGYESVALMPMRVGEERLGLLQLNDRRRGMFTPESIALWERLTGYLAVALAKIRAQEELGKSQRLINSVVAGTTDAIYVKDTSGRYLLFNAGAEVLTGLPAATVLGKDDSSLFTPEGAKIVMDDDRAVISSGTRQTSEETVTSLSGKQHTYLSTKGPLFDEEGRIISLFGISRDITQRKEMEKELRRSRDDLEIRVQERAGELVKAVELLTEQAALLDLARDAILVRDLEGSIRYWNTGAEKTYGWTKDEALGNISDDLLHTRFPGPQEEIVADVLAVGQWEGELCHTTRSGTQIVVASRWAIKKGPDGNPLAILEINRDITEWMKMAEEREQLISDLRSALAKVKLLSGFLPICASCKKIRDDKGYWQQIEAYIRDHSEAEFSHSICPECAKKLYPRFFKG